MTMNLDILLDSHTFFLPTMQYGSRHIWTQSFRAFVVLCQSCVDRVLFYLLFIHFSVSLFHENCIYFFVVCVCMSLETILPFIYFQCISRGFSIVAEMA